MGQPGCQYRALDAGAEDYLLSNQFFTGSCVK